MFSFLIWSQHLPSPSICGCQIKWITIDGSDATKVFIFLYFRWKLSYTKQYTYPVSDCMYIYGTPTKRKDPRHGEVKTIAHGPATEVTAHNVCFGQHYSNTIQKVDRYINLLSIESPPDIVMAILCASDIFRVSSLVYRCAFNYLFLVSSTWMHRTV